MDGGLEGVETEGACEGFSHVVEFRLDGEAYLFGGVGVIVSRVGGCVGIVGSGSDLLCSY